MSDAENKDQPLEAMTGDVHGLLDKAEALTEELRAEVGAEHPQPTEREAEFFQSTTDSEASMDAQMAAVDSALDKTAAELGAAPAESAPAPPPKPKTIALPPKGAAAPPAATPAPAAVAAPPPPPAPLNAPGQAAAPAAAAPANTITLPRRPPSGQAPAATDNPAKLVAGQVATTPFPVESAAPAGEVAPVVPAGANQTSERLLSSICGVLDVLDRPFNAISYQVRWWIGWAALLLLGAAVFIFIFAVL